MDAFDLSGFHGYDPHHYYDQGWEGQPDIFWECGDNFNPWDLPSHQYYGDFEHQPFDQEQPHQYHGSGKKSLEEMVADLVLTNQSFMNETRASLRNQEASIKNLETQLEHIAKTIADGVPEFFCPQALEGGEKSLIIHESDIVEKSEEPHSEEEFPKGDFTNVLETESDNRMGEQMENVIECNDVHDVSIEDFVFGDKMQKDEEETPSLSINLKDLWINGKHGKEQARGWNSLSTKWKQISESFLKPSIFNLIYVAMIFGNAGNMMMQLCQNLHDLKDLMQFAINPG